MAWESQRKSMLVAWFDDDDTEHKWGKNFSEIHLWNQCTRSQWWIVNSVILVWIVLYDDNVIRNSR